MHAVRSELRLRFWS